MFRYFKELKLVPAIREKLWTFDRINKEKKNVKGFMPQQTANFVLAYKSIVAKEIPNYYECIEENQPIYFYLDMELEVDKGNDAFSDELNNQFKLALEKVCEFLNDLYKTTPLFSVLDGTRPGKFSRHVIFTNIVLKEVYHAKRLLNDGFNQYCVKHAFTFPQMIDTKVYNKTRSMRLIYSSKLGSTVPLRWMNGPDDFANPRIFNEDHFYKSLITLVDASLPVRVFGDEGFLVERPATGKKLNPTTRDSGAQAESGSFFVNRCKAEITKRGFDEKKYIVKYEGFDVKYKLHNVRASAGNGESVKCRFNDTHTSNTQIFSFVDDGALASYRCFGCEESIKYKTHLEPLKITGLLRTSNLWRYFDVDTFKPLGELSRESINFLTKGVCDIQPDELTTNLEILEVAGYLGLWLHHKEYMDLFHILDDDSQVLTWSINKVLKYKFAPFEDVDSGFNIHKYVELKAIDITTVLGHGYTTCDFESVRQFIQTGDFEHLFYIQTSPIPLLQKFGIVKQQNGVYYRPDSQQQQFKRRKVDPPNYALYTHVTVKNIEYLTRPPPKRALKVTILKSSVSPNEYFIINTGTTKVPGSTLLQDVQLPLRQNTVTKKPICVMFDTRQAMMTFSKIKHPLFSDRFLVEIFGSTLFIDTIFLAFMKSKKL